jgi:sugar phosphate isomerase/epimerase
MKLGIAGLLPHDITELDATAIRRVAAIGFAGVAFSPSNPPVEISTERAREVGRICAGEGVALIEYGQYETTFVDPDERVRARTLATVREACRVARAAGCPAVVAGVGSRNPASQWFPHAENYAPESRDLLVSTVTDAVRIAEDQGVILALECHVATSLRDATTARALLDAVASPSLKIHLDPVNWMTFETIYDSGPAIAAMFATLGPNRISGVHSKGVSVENRFITHLNETWTGAGDDLLDHTAVLRGLTGLPGDPYLVIEHLTIEQMPSARRHLLAIAERLGVSFGGPSIGRA